MSISRRVFLGGTAILGTAAALAYYGGKSTLMKVSKKNAPPSDRMRIALIGAGSHARRKLAKGFAGLPDVDIVHVCDADRRRARAMAKKLSKDWHRRTYACQDMRKVFDDKTIDAVVVATPHHWHALAAVWAMESGKHVYLEKPVTHTLAEGQVLRDAAARYGMVVQSGTHRRSTTVMDEVAKYIQSGKLGKVQLARCIAYRGRKPIGAPQIRKPPKTVDYNLWSGPVPMLPITRKRFHYDWHFIWEYGDGGLGNNGVHRVDLARWGLGLKGLGDAVVSYGGRFGEPDAGATPNTQVVIHKFGDVSVVQELRGFRTAPRDLCKAGVVFYGTEGRIVYQGEVATLYDPAGREVSQFGGEIKNPYANFISAVRAQEPSKLRGGLEEGIQSAALCHVGSISHRVGSTASDADVQKALESFGCHDDVLKTFELTRQHLADNDTTGDFVLGQALKLDPNAERILTDDESTLSLTTGTYRPGFKLPDPTGLVQAG